MRRKDGTRILVEQYIFANRWQNDIVWFNYTFVNATKLDQKHVYMFIFVVVNRKVNKQF